jgi:hypothetical protein
LRGLLVVFHRDLTIAKNETIPEGGGINELLEYIKGDPGKRTADLARGINNSTRTTERWIKLLAPGHHQSKKLGVKSLRPVAQTLSINYVHNSRTTKQCS